LGVMRAKDSCSLGLTRWMEVWCLCRCGATQEERRRDRESKKTEVVDLLIVMSRAAAVPIIAVLSLGWRQDNGNWSNQESKFDFLATRQCLVKIDEGQQKIKIVRTNRQSNLRCSCQSIFSLS